MEAKAGVGVSAEAESAGWVGAGGECRLHGRKEEEEGVRQGGMTP